MLKKLLLFISLVLTGYLNAQTYYWVGGSGYWNDMNHWSFMSGGKPANSLPTSNADVIFDDQSNESELKIHFSNSVKIYSVIIKRNIKISFVKSTSQSILEISGGFNNLSADFYSDIDYEFNNNSSTESLINFGVSSLNSDFKILSGSWKIKNIITDNNNRLFIENSKVNFQGSYINVGHLTFKNNAELHIISSVFQINHTFLSLNNSNELVSKSYLKGSFRDNTNFNQSSLSRKFEQDVNLAVNGCIATPIIVKPSCVPGCDGKIIFTIPSPTSACFASLVPPVSPPFNVVINNGAGCTVIPTLTGISAGTYTLSNICNCNTDYSLLLFDQNQFIETQNAPVTAPNVSAILTSSIAPKCFGVCTGSINLNFIGGVAPYNFTITPPSAPTTNTTTNGALPLTNLCAGTLSVSAIDSKSCTAAYTYSISQPSQLVANGSSTNIICNGTCSGAVNVSPTGGTPNYTVNWSTPSTQVLTSGGSSSQTNLCSGVISSTVTDSKGCIVNYSTTISQPSAVNLTISKTDLVCAGNCNGTASVTASGGIGATTYSWSPSGGTGASATGLCAGNYTCTVTNNGSCVKTITVTITSPASLTTSPTQTNLTCNAVCSGSINLHPSGGTGAYSYTWAAPAVSSASTAINLCAGVYSYTVADASLCKYSNTVNITQPPASTLSIVGTNITCFGACNGSAVSTMTGGVAPYTYSWSPGGQTTSSISSLCPNTYTLTVKDVSLCPTTKTITITQQPVITTNSVATPPTCSGGCNGSITAAPTGGTGPFTYTLQSSIAAQITTNPPYTNLCAANYTLIVKDAAGCIVTSTVNLAVPSPLTLTLNPSVISCFGQCNGSVSAVVGGGTPTYTVNWTPAGTGLTLSSQCAGVVTATVTDAQGCKTSKTTTITAKPDLTISIVPTNPNCSGACTGIATSTVTGGTPSYTVNWSNGNVGAITSASLCQGNYTATVTDALGCTKTQTVAITTPPAITLTATTGSVNCSGVCNGSVSVSPSGGTSPYSYSWNTTPAQTTSVTTATLCAGNYIATVTDAKGCIASKATSVTQPPVLTVSASNIVPSCNICVGSGTANGAGGTGPYTYTWQPGGQTSQVPVNLCSGTQTLTVKDSKNCTATQTVNIPQTVITLVTSNGSPILCNNVCTGIAVTNPSGGTTPYTYSWSPGNPIGQGTQTITSLCAGAYTSLVTDKNGCSATNTISFANPPAITVTVNKTNATCNGSCNGSATVTASGGTGALSYTWQPGNLHTASVSGLCAGTYSLDVSDVNNCTKSQTFTITQNPILTVTFTPSNPTTCTSVDGAITFTAGGGVGPYTHTWTPGGTGNLTNVAAGTYSLTVKDAAGCSQTTVTTLSSPVGPTVTVNTTSVACFGGSTGSASLTIIGTPTISVIWPAPISSTNTTVSNLSAGVYIPKITDGNGCIVNPTVNIAQSPSLTASGVVKNVLCNAVCNGSIDLTPTGGAGGYTYTWSPSGGNIQDPTSLCANNYTVVTKDINNCSITNTFVVTQPSSLTLTFNKKDVACNSGCTGAVRAVVGGGTIPYTYSWIKLSTNTPAGALDTIVNLCTDIYSVTATDNNGCIISGTVNIGQPGALTSTITSVNIKCNGQCTGAATITANGGGTPYVYSFVTSSVTPTPTIGGLCVGTYTGNVTDANGCQVSHTFAITQPAPIVITTTLSNPKCHAANNGSVTTTVTGGNPNYHYSWVPTSFTVANPTGLSAGNYTLNVTDDSLCTAQALVVLTDPAILLATTSFTNPSCNTNCDGIVSAVQNGGTPPYTYSWATPAVVTNSTVSNLCAGDYTFTLTDANLCQDVQIVTLTNPAPLTVNPGLSPALCGVSNGSINAIVSGGTPIYTYNWLAPIPAAQSTNSFVTGIPAGSYTLNVSDARACTSTVVIGLSNSNGPTGATVTKTMVTCNTRCDGSISITNPVGGTSPFIFNWLPPLAVAQTTNSSSVSALCAGTYTTKITDVNNCLFFLPVTITEPFAITDNAILSNATCQGICDGAISLTPSGGNGTYTYSWSPSALNTGTISSLCPGAYTSTITDSKGCTLVSNYNLQSLFTITSNTFATDNTCFGDCNGSLLATNVAGGTNPYTFSWSDPLGQSTALASNLCNGNYSVTIRDANGCFNVISGSITSPSQVTFTPTITQPSCNLCNGVAVISPVGGTPNYTYLWSANNQTKDTVSNLCAGVYGLQITDGNGCITKSNVVINNSSNITGETINFSNASCGGACDGTVTVSAIGGISPISYNWLHNNSNSQTLNGLCAGTYFCNMMDATGCLRTASIVIGATTDLTITPQVSQSSCSVADGSITVSVSGGTGVYSFNWLPGGIKNDTLTSLAPGNYTLTVSDGVCSKTQVFVVNSANGPIISATQQNITCNGVCDGSISLTISGGTPTYTTTWSNAASTTSINALCAGSYSVQVVDGAGCIAIQNFSLTTQSPIIFSIPDVNGPVCNGDCNGSITTIPSGGVLPYTYLWTTSSSTTSVASGLCSNSYSVLVTDANGCSSIETFTVTNPPVLTLTASITNASCNTTLDGAINVTTIGGIPGYTYSWTPGAILTEDIANVLPGSYTLTIIDNFGTGCLFDSVMKIVPTIFVDAIVGRDTTFCEKSVFLLDGSKSVGGTSYKWLQLPINTVISSTLTTSVSPAAGTSTYVLIATNGACSDSDSIQVTSLALPIVDAGNYVSIPIYGTTIIGGSPTAASGDTIHWTPVIGLDNPLIANPTSSSSVTTQYTVTVIDANGCKNIDTITVSVYPEITIPNGFSPNGDGKNDVWQIDVLNKYPDCEVEVYNRWGEKLFYSKGYSIPFNGQYKGKDLPVGTYYYVVKLNNPDFPDAFTSPLTIFR